MKSFEGYIKRKLDGTYLLLANGSTKSIGDFIGSISWDADNKKIQYTPAGGSKTDLIQFGSNAFNSTAYLPITGGTITGALTVKQYIFGYNYNHAGGNVPAFVFDKPGSNFTGIGANGETDTIYFSAATLSNGEASWVTSYKQKWKFNGTIYQEDNAVIHAGNIGSQSVSYATSAGSAGSVAWSNVSNKPTTLSGYGITDGLYSTQVSSTQNNVTWAINLAKTTRRAFIYNTNSTEWSYLFGLSSSNTSVNNENCATYGVILKMSYIDKYLRMIRVHGGKWYKTDGTLNATAGATDGVDWEKISAGYADSAGIASQVKDAGNDTAITFKYSAGGFTTNPSWLGAWNGYLLTYVSPSVLSVNYATSAGSADALTYRTYPSQNNDPASVLAGGGITRNYGSSAYWKNCPSGLSYGACVEFYAGSESLSGQFIWDVNHNDTSSTRNLYFRASNNLGWQNDWKRIAWASEIPTTMAWSSITGKPSTFTPSSHDHDSSYIIRSGDTVTGHFTFKGRVFGYNYANQGNNAAAFMWDKPGSHFTGMGPNGVSNQIHFGPCDASGAWVASFTQQWEFLGNVYAASYYTTSDARKKQNIHNISDNIKQFEWKESGETSYGFVAQDLEVKHPELVNDDGNTKTVNYNAALSLVVAKLENRVKELEAKLGIETSPHI